MIFKNVLKYPFGLQAKPDFKQILKLFLYGLKKAMIKNEESFSFISVN